MDERFEPGDQVAARLPSGVTRYGRVWRELGLVHVFLWSDKLGRYMKNTRAFDRSQLRRVESPSVTNLYRITEENN